MNRISPKIVLAAYCSLYTSNDKCFQKLSFLCIVYVLSEFSRHVFVPQPEHAGGGAIDVCATRHFDRIVLGVPEH